MTDILPKRRADAMMAVSPDRITEPPEVADFPSQGRHGGADEPLKMKSPQQTARLIKKIATNSVRLLLG